MMIRLEDYESPFGTISIFKAKSTGAITYEQGGCCQSEADSNGTSLATYIHAIYNLVWQTKARSVLLIGCGGGTLGTMLARVGRTVTIVDVNPASFLFARQYFDLPDSVSCEVADAKDFLISDASTYDVVVLDAFHGDRIPAHLQSLRFFRLVHDHLTPQGSVFVNIHVKHGLDDHADRLADCMSSVWPQVRLLDSQVSLGRNVVAMAGAVSHLSPPCVLVQPMADADEIDAELAMMRYRVPRVRP